MESKKMKSESVVPGEQKKTEFALGKTNIILIAVAFVVIVVGFLLMLAPVLHRRPITPIYLVSVVSCWRPV